MLQVYSEIEVRSIVVAKLVYSYLLLKLYYFESDKQKMLYFM